MILLHAIVPHPNFRERDGVLGNASLVTLLLAMLSASSAVEGWVMRGRMIRCVCMVPSKIAVLRLRLLVVVVV